MINFNTPTGDISVKSSYFDLTCQEYDQITANPKDFIFVFSVLTGIPEENLICYDLSKVVDFISFLQESPRNLEPLDFITINGNIFFQIEIFEQTWAKKITADELVRVIEPSEEGQPEEFIISDLVELVAIYTTKQKKKFNESKIQETRKTLDKMPVSEVYPFGLFLQKQLIDIKKAERLSLKPQYTPEQIQAGIHQFNKLGVFNTIDMIMKEYSFDYDKAVRQPYSFVFNKLVLSNISATFEKRLSKILRDQNKPIGTKNT